MKNTQRRHALPVYRKPAKGAKHHWVKIPYVASHGEKSCPCEYNNGLHAAVHSLLAAMMVGGKQEVIYWMNRAGIQLQDAQKCIRKPGAKVPVVGQVFEYREEDA